MTLKTGYKDDCQLHKLVSMGDANLLHELADKLEAEWQMGGLSDGLYFDWAAEIALRFHEAKSAMENANEWTDEELHNLVLDLRVATESPENIHRLFAEILKPWFDRHNRRREDLMYRYHNDLRFNQFVQRMIAEALAAEREKIRLLGEALREIANSTNSHIANNALAKLQHYDIAPTGERDWVCFDCAEDGRPNK